MAEIPRFPPPSRLLRLGFVGGGEGALIGEAHANRAPGFPIAGKSSPAPYPSQSGARAALWEEMDVVARSRLYGLPGDGGEGGQERSTASTRSALRTPNHLHHPVAAALSGTRHRRHLRQASHDEIQRTRSIWFGVSGRPAWCSASPTLSRRTSWRVKRVK